MCVHRNTCNDIVYRKLGINPIGVDIKVKIVSYWIRRITGRQEKLAYVMYQSLLHLNTAVLYTSPWLKEIRSILNKCGLLGVWLYQECVCTRSVVVSGVWLYQEVPNPVWLRKTVEQRLKDQWIFHWS